MPLRVSLVLLSVPENGQLGGQRQTTSEYDQIRENVRLSRCWIIEVLDYRGVGLLRCWIIEVLDYRGVGLSRFCCMCKKDTLSKKRGYVFQWEYLISCNGTTGLCGNSV